MRSQRFSALDGMRGVAALLVMLLHSRSLLGAHIFEHAYLMVDLFFLMSGFVLSATYGQPLRTGGGRWFAGRRLLRLYPLALLGMVLGAAVDVTLSLRGGHALQPNFALTFALGVALLPWLAGGLISPFDGPLWSLQAEFWTNVVYGFVARRVTLRRLTILVGLAALALIVCTALTGSMDSGSANNDPARHAGPWAFLAAWARIGFAFPLGLLLHQMFAAGRLPKVPAALALAAIPLVLAAVSVIPLATPAVLDIAIVAVVFPGLLILAVGCAPTGAAERACERLGRLSYALYAVHVPVLVLLRGLAPAGLPPAGRVALWGLGVALSVLAALAAERWMDRPARRWAATFVLGEGRARAPAPTAPPVGAA